MTGLQKDPRDTERRRLRHKDGRLLRAGMGLTTGLGWSDRYATPLLFCSLSSCPMQRGRRCTITLDQEAHPQHHRPSTFRLSQFFVASRLSV